MVNIQFDLWSWYVGLILMFLSFLALIFGSLPDNPTRPLGDAMRLITWPLLILWLIGAVLKGIGVFG